MRRIFVLVGVFCLLAGGMAFAAQPLSSLPNWSYATSNGPSEFQVFLDSRYASNASVCKPEGGVKFELWLTSMVTKNVAITRVEYVNTTTKESHAVAGHSYLMPDGSGWTEYSLWLGHQWNLIGKWNLKVTTASNGVFTYAFAITDAMLEKKTKPPRPAINVKKKLNAKGNLTGYVVTATTPSFAKMKARLTIFENNGDDTLYRSSYSVSTGKTLQFNVPRCLTSSVGTDCDLTGNPSRIEVKNNDGTPTPWFIYVYSPTDGKTATRPAPARTIQNFSFPK
jgi:hypothetical protein